MTGEDFDNNKINVWMHLHGLPFELRNIDSARNIAEYAGKVKSQKTDLETSQGFGKEYMNVRIEVDITKPLLPGLFLKRPHRNPT